MADNVGVRMPGEIKPHRDSARAGHLRIVIGHVRHAGEIG